MKLLLISDDDDCQGVTCQNGGTCIDGVASFSCDCLAGYSGKFCGTSMITQLIYHTYLAGFVFNLLSCQKYVYYCFSH